MSGPDRRPVIRARAWQAKAEELTWREKCYLVRLTELPAELDPMTGRRRYGSRAMDAQGKVSLHRDYLARMLGTDVEAIRKAQQACIKKGYLGMVWAARHGLPTTLQAFAHRGAESVDLRGVELTSLGEAAVAPHRGVGLTPLDLERPSVPGPAPSLADSDASGCQYHNDAHPCPDDCVNYSSANRRTA